MIKPEYVTGCVGLIACVALQELGFPEARPIAVCTLRFSKKDAMCGVMGGCGAMLGCGVVL